MRNLAIFLLIEFATVICLVILAERTRSKRRKELEGK